MPNVNPGAPPGGTGGTTTTPDKFPQWGVKSTAGNTTTKGSDQIAEAHDPAEKVNLIKQGYVVWFASKKAAEDWIKNETGPFSGNLPSPLHGLDAIGNFFGQLSQANTWIRVGEVVLGIVLIGIGLARITGTANVVSQVVKARIP